MSLRYWNLEVAARNNPKLLAAGKDAFALWCLCSLYSAEQLTDGFVPQVELDRLVRDWKLEDGLRVCLSALVPGRGPLLDKVAGGVTVHDYLDYNPSGDYMKRLTRERRSAGQKGGNASVASKCSKQVLEASAPSNGIVRSSVGSSVPSDPEGGRKGGTGVPPSPLAALALRFEELRKEILGWSGAPDQTGAGVVLPLLDRLPDEDREPVLRAFLADTEKWLVDNSHPLSRLDERRINRYLGAMKATKDAPPRVDKGIDMERWYQ